MERNRNLKMGKKKGRMSMPNKKNKMACLVLYRYLWKMLFQFLSVCLLGFLILPDVFGDGYCVTDPPVSYPTITVEFKTIDIMIPQKTWKQHQTKSLILRR
jgi:hypothetical protein